MTAPAATDGDTRRVLNLLDLASKAVDAYQRPDLAPMIDRARQRYLRPETNVLIIGEFKKGKSALINAVTDATVCPVDDDLATAVPTFLRHGEEPAAALVRGTERESITIDTITTLAVESADGEPVEAIEVTLPRRILEHGLTLVDTPGVGGLDSNHGAATIGALALADAVVFVSDASQEYTAPELEFLDHARRLCPIIVCVVTKVDLYPHWRQVVEGNRAHLASSGHTAGLIAVSSEIRSLALRLSSKELNQESGFPTLISWLRALITDRQTLGARVVGSTVADVVEHLTASFRSERAVLTDPETRAQIIADLETATRSAEQLKSSGSRWQQTLSDGLSDLTSDVMFDLRTRLRGVTEQTDALIDENDPSAIWDEFQALAERSVREAIVGNFEFLRTRADELAAQVEAHFGDGEDSVEDLLAVGPADVETLDLSADDNASGGLGATVTSTLTALRGSYSGILMFNMLGGMIGLSAIAPVTIALGVFMGAKALRGERQKQLAAARQSAKQSVRKYLESVTNQVTKDSQDTLKQVQRTLRDRYSERATRLQRSVADALKAAQQAARTDESERTSRIADIDAELARLQELAKMAAALATTRSGA